MITILKKQTKKRPKKQKKKKLKLRIKCNADNVFSRYCIIISHNMVHTFMLLDWF